MASDAARKSETDARDARAIAASDRNLEIDATAALPVFLQMNETKKKKIISKNKINVPHRSGSSADHVTYGTDSNQRKCKKNGEIIRSFQVCTSTP